MHYGMPNGISEYGKHIGVNMPKHGEIQGRLSGAINARNIVQSQIDVLRAQGKDVKTLEKMIKVYNRDIEGYRKTLGIK